MALPRIGGHLSIARGFAAMAREAQRIGCETAQVFTRSPRGGPARPIVAAEADALGAALAEADVRPLVVHVPYYVTPANDKDDFGRLATQIITDDGRRAALLGAPYVVLHAGHRRGDSPSSVVAAVVERVGAAAANLANDAATAGKVTLLVENGPGSRGDAAGSLELWAACVHGLREQGLPVGACLDTAHLWAAGWDLGLKPGPMNADVLAGPAADAAVACLVDGLVRSDMLPLLHVLHLNDSSAAYGSGLDRHEHIGAGLIPLGLFEGLLRDGRLAGAAGIVETDPDAGGVERDVALLKRLRSLSGRQALRGQPG